MGVWEDILLLLGQLKEAGSLWRGVPKELLDIGADKHGAEDVEEGHGAVCVVEAWQVAVGNAGEEGDGRERQFGNNNAVETDICA